MKIAIVLESRLQDGGGFQQSINSINSICKNGKHELMIFNSKKDNDLILKELNIKFTDFKFNLIQKLINHLMRNMYFFSILSRIVKNNFFERLMKIHGIDFIYFVSPSSLALDCIKIPFAFTVWDLCHLEHPEFGEVRDQFEFEKREKLYSRVLPKSSFVVADSNIGKRKLIENYKLNSERVVVQYFEPSYYVLNCEPSLEILKEYNLEPGYYFYPAQFWKHKNHKLILKAAKKIILQNPSIKFVFSGSDKGYLKEICQYVKDNRLESNVFLLGFIPNSHLSTLYYFSKALIMPTFFGPSNIPPIEAYVFNKPILYTFSNYLDEILKDYKYKFFIDFYDENILINRIFQIEELEVEDRRNKFSPNSNDFNTLLNQIEYKIK